MDIDPATDRGGISGDHLEGRHAPGAFETGDDRLRSPHVRGNVSLREAGGSPRFDQLANHGEDWTQPVVLGPHCGVGQQLLPEFHKAGHDVISLARRSANCVCQEPYGGLPLQPTTPRSGPQSGGLQAQPTLRSRFRAGERQSYLPTCVVFVNKRA